MRARVKARKVSTSFMADALPIDILAKYRWKCWIGLVDINQEYLSLK